MSATCKNQHSNCRVETLVSQQARFSSKARFGSIARTRSWRSHARTQFVIHLDSADLSDGDSLSAGTYYPNLSRGIRSPGYYYRDVKLSGTATRRKVGEICSSRTRASGAVIKTRRFSGMLRSLEA